MQSKPPSQRQLQVSEQIRFALSNLFLTGEVAEIDGASITVSQVTISPDLKHCTAYIMPLGGKDKERLLEILSTISPQIRHLISKKVKLRYTPTVKFKLDESFEYAANISRILHDLDAEGDNN